MTVQLHEFDVDINHELIYDMDENETIHSDCSDMISITDSNYSLHPVVNDFKDIDPCPVDNGFRDTTSPLRPHLLALLFILQ